MAMKQTALSVQGMTCNHCRQAVHNVLTAIPGVENVTVDLEAARAEVWHSDSVTTQQMADAVNRAGFKAAPE